MWPARPSSCRPHVPAGESLGTASFRIAPKHRASVPSHHTSSLSAASPGKWHDAPRDLRTHGWHTVNKVAATYPGSLGAQARVRCGRPRRNPGKYAAEEKETTDDMAPNYGRAFESCICRSGNKRLAPRGNASRRKDQCHRLLPATQTYPQATAPTAVNSKPAASRGAIGRSSGSPQRAMAASSKARTDGGGGTELRVSRSKKTFTLSAVAWQVSPMNSP